MMRVLLVSPTDPDIPKNLVHLVGGENTYTKTLLGNPPAGVKYIHHLEALKKGLVEYLPLQRKLEKLVRFRILPLSAGSQCFYLKDKFDLIHCHAYSIKTVGVKTPLVISDSSSNYLFLKDYLGWPIWRIRVGYSLRRFLFKNLGVVDPDTNIEDAIKLIVFSQFAKRIHIQLGVDEDKIIVLPPGLPQPTKRNFSKSKKIINILFVGIWFERKGGPILLEAFKRLWGKYPNIRLVIVGEVPEKFKVLASLRGRSGQSSKCKVFDYVPRERLMREFFPKTDIFVLVPPKVEGYGFVVLEAMSFGIPVIVSDICALPELVRNGKTGFVVKPGSVSDLTRKLEILITHEGLRKRMGEAARKLFREKFSVERSNEKLLEVYRQVLS